MAFTRGIKWDDDAVKFPNDMDWGFSEISTKGSGRSLSGKMSKVVVAPKRTVSCKWYKLTDTEAAAILGTIKDQTFGSLYYPDPFAGTSLTKTFYTSDAKAKMISVDGGLTCIWDISFDFIEQ